MSSIQCDRRNADWWKRRYIFCYTILFLILSLIVFSVFFIRQKTLIWEYDGWMQHYKALIYYGRYLREIGRSLFLEHSFQIPEWEFALGEGSDIVETLHYYVIGDPFSFLSVFVPSQYTYILYGVLILLRMYAAGLAFSTFCFFMKQSSRAAVLAGSMVHVFSFWMIYNSERHPYFLNPLIYLPLILIGIEMLLQGRRPWLLTVMVAVCGLSNFYFFYILAILSVLYTVLRILYLHRRAPKEAGRLFLRFLGACTYGVLLAAVILLPMIYAFLNSPRMSGQQTYHLFYPIVFYRQYLAHFAVPGESFWMCMGFAAPALPAVLLLFLGEKRRGNGFLKLLYPVCIILSLFPVFGQALNGFSYMANRWSFALPLLAAYTVTLKWQELRSLSKREGRILACAMAVYGVLSLLLTDSARKILLIQLGIMFLFLLMMLYGNRIWKHRKQLLSYAGIGLICISAALNGAWHFSPKGSDYVASGVGKVLASRVEQNETVLVEKTAKQDGTEGFYRYTGKGLSRNAGFLSGISSTQFYWTISPPLISQFRTEMEMSSNSQFDYSSYEDRSALLSLACAKYYILGPDVDYPPYAYELTDYLKMDDESFMPREDVRAGYWIYRTDEWLPLGITFDSYIPKDQWLALSSVEKQEALLQAVVLEDSDRIGLPQCEPEWSGQELEYRMESSGNAEIKEDGSIVVSAGNASVKFEFEGIPDSELYVCMSGMQFEPYLNGEPWDYSRNGAFEKTEVILRSSEGVKKDFTYLTEESGFYNNRHDFTLCMNYSENGESYVRMIFQDPGVYRFDSIRVICQPMESYREQIRALQQETLQNVHLDTDEITGTITVGRPSMLLLSMPWSAGWTAWVDDAETELYQADTMRMALRLEPGEHTIRLVYHSPFLREGAAVSAIALILFCAGAIYRRRKQKEK